MSSRPITGFFLIFVDEQIEMIIHPSLFTWTEISTTLVEDVYS